MNNSPYQTGNIAYANAILSVISTITIILMFSLSFFWGPINDANSVLWSLTFVPLIWLFYQWHRADAPLLALLAAAVGIGAAVAFAILQTLLVLGVVTFQQTFLTVTTLMAFLGLALLIHALLARSTGTLPSRLTWVTMGYGISFIIGGVGFWLGGWEHPLGIGGFLLTALLGPVWGFWLGRALKNGRLGPISANNFSYDSAASKRPVNL